MNTKRKALAAVLVLAAAQQGAHAEGLALDQRAWIQLGLFQPSIDSSLRVDGRSASTPGTSVDGEQTFGLQRRDRVPSLLLGLRLAEHWRVEFEHQVLDRRRQVNLQGSGDLAFGGAQYQAEIDVRMRSRLDRLSVGYSFWRTPQLEMGLALGVHYSDFLLSARGSAVVDGQQRADWREQREDRVPAPTLGLYGAYQFGAGWQLQGRADVFKLSRGGYDGRVLNLQANAQYRLSRHLGLGLGWRFDDLRLNGQGDRFSGKLEYGYRGPQLFLDLGF